MNAFENFDGSTDIAREVIARAKLRRCAQVLAIMDDGTVRISPACKIEGERLIENHREQYVGTYNGDSELGFVSAEVKDRMFQLILSRMRAAEAVVCRITPAGRAALVQG